MLGCGVVGSQVARLLQDDQQELSERSGAHLVLSKVGVRKAGARPGVDASLITTDLASIVNDPAINIVIEVMGGIEPARTLILEAIKNKKSVITANKALLATHGHELFNAADEAKVDLYYEAAVAGAIPIIRSMRESLAGDQITRVMGIVNGTTNYILTKMHEEGRAFEDVLKEAQALGYAESDPTADIEGHDAAAKAALLASLAFHSTVTIDEVYTDAPTASAILGDLVAVTRHAAYSTVGYGESDYADLDIAPIGAVKSQFFVRLHVADKSGVLATIASTFSSENVSIQTVRQAGLGEDAELIVVTHAASEDALDACVQSLRKLEIVRKVESVIRVEGAPA